jgi:GT2 family glycosyltransferase
MIDIVILSYSANPALKKQTEECLKSLFDSEENSEEIFNVIILESQDGVVWEGYPNTKTYIPPKPYGYHKFMNFGRKLGNSPYVCLCNNDLIFEKNWATEMLKAASELPDVFSFSPLCPKTQPLYGILPNSGNHIGYQIRKEISGWCIFQRREIYEKIGDLDESFTHWFSDNDYSLSLYEKLIKHCLVSSSIVEHHDMNIGKTGPAVFSEEEMEKSTSGSYHIFKEKWGKYFS